MESDTPRGSFSSTKQYEYATRNPNKETSYSRVISNYRLSDWMKKYGVSPTALFQVIAEREFFVDQHGIKRYTDNWQPVPLEHDLEQLLSQSSEDFFFHTGCMKLSHIYDYYRRWTLDQGENQESDESRQEDKESTSTKTLPEKAPAELECIAYMSEWQRLWIFLENHSDHDSLAEYAPFFRVLIEFLFHPRLQTVMMVMLTYNYIVNILLLIFFPSAIDSISIVYIFCELTIQTITYFAIVVVYRGVVTDPPEPAFPLDGTLLQDLSPNAIINNLNSGFTNIHSGLRDSLQQVTTGVNQFGAPILGSNFNLSFATSAGTTDARRSELDSSNVGNPVGKDRIEDYTVNPIRPSTLSQQPGMSPSMTAAVPGTNNEMKETNPVVITPITHSTNVRNHFRLVRNELFSRIRFEIARLHPCLSRLLSRNSEKLILQQKQKKFLRYKTRMKKLSYHEILNIAVKFLVDVNHINMQTINFDRKSYRLILLFIVLFYPFYLFIYNYFIPYILPLSVECPDGIHPFTGDEKCRYMFYFFIFTLGTFTKYIVQLIFAMSILVALVSLSYGSEIAYRLTDAWIKKFKSLRRVEEYDMEEYLQQVLSTHQKPPPAATAAGSEHPRSSNPSIKPFQTTTSSKRLEKKMFSSSSFRADIPLLPVSSSVSSPAVDFPFVSKRPFHFENEKNVCEHPLYYWVKRDAVEHYFFICEVFQSMDKIWSPALTFIFIIGFGLSFIYILYAVFNDNISHSLQLIQLIVFVTVRLFVLFIYPLMSLCHANAYIYELTNSFKRSSKDDFQLIGGCEQWVDFMESCPAAWTYNGIWITWDRLLGLLWTLAAAGATSGIGIIFSIFVGAGGGR